MDLESYITWIYELTEDLFRLKFENDKYIIVDKKRDVAVEILQMTLNSFNVELKEGDHLQDFTSISFNLSLSVSKKQKLVAQLFESEIQKVLNKLFNIVDLNDEVILYDKEVNDKLKQSIVYQFDTVTDYLQQQSNYDDVIWNQPLFDKARISLGEEMERALYKPKGVKGLGKCGKCGSEELHYKSQQTRSCDEPETAFFSCIRCGNKWRI